LFFLHRHWPSTKVGFVRRWSQTTQVHERGTSLAQEPRAPRSKLFQERPGRLRVKSLNQSHLGPTDASKLVVQMPHGAGVKVYPRQVYSNACGSTKLLPDLVFARHFRKWY
jgi:hypothetical protein